MRERERRGRRERLFKCTYSYIFGNSQNLVTLSFPLIEIKEIKLFRCVLVINGLDYAKCGVKWMKLFLAKH